MKLGVYHPTSNCCRSNCIQLGEISIQSFSGVPSTTQALVNSTISTQHVWSSKAPRRQSDEKMAPTASVLKKQFLLQSMRTSLGPNTAMNSSLSVALSKSPGFAQLHQLHHHLLSTVGPGQREDPLDPLDADVQHTKSPKNFEGSENIYENQNCVFFQQICWFANLFCKCATNKKRFPKLHLDKEPVFWNAWMLGSLEGPDTQNTGVIQYLLVFNSDLQGKVTSPNKQKTTIIHSTAFQSQRTSSPLPLPAAAPRSPSNVPWQTIMDTAEAKATKAALGPDPHFFIPRKSMAYEFPI